jgi:hypothetical protein
MRRGNKHSGPSQEGIERLVRTKSMTGKQNWDAGRRHFWWESCRFLQWVSRQLCATFWLNVDMCVGEDYEMAKI